MTGHQGSVPQPPLPGAAREEGASCPRAPQRPSEHVCAAHGFLGGLAQREQLSARPLFPGLTLRGLEEGRGVGLRSGRDLRGPCATSSLFILQSEVTGPGSQFQKPEVLTCRAALLGAPAAWLRTAAQLLPRVETKNWERQSQKVRKRKKESLPAQRKKVRKWTATGAVLPPRLVVLWSGV